MISRLLKRIVSESVPKAIGKVLDERLPYLVEEIMEKKFRDNPDMPLSEVGFNWAFYLALKKYWTNIDGVSAVAWLWEYMDVPYGTAGYDWTPAAANMIAADYALECGND